MRKSVAQLLIPRPLNPNGREKRTTNKMRSKIQDVQFCIMQRECAKHCLIRGKQITNLHITLRVFPYSMHKRFLMRRSVNERTNDGRTIAPGKMHSWLFFCMFSCQLQGWEQPPFSSTSNLIKFYTFQPTRKCCNVFSIRESVTCTVR